MARQINKKQQNERKELLLRLLRDNPEAIQLNMRKLIQLAGLSLNDYQILHRTWKELKKDVTFSHYLRR